MFAAPRPFRLALIAASLALPALVGCTDLNSGQDTRTGRGKGDELPSTGPGSAGTNATTGDLTTEGPGSKVVDKAPKVNPSQSTPYGGSGAGVAPPVSPEKGAPASGDSNSGQGVGKQQGPGADASTEAAKPAPGGTGPGTGTPPR